MGKHKFEPEEDWQRCKRCHVRRTVHGGTYFFWFGKNDPETDEDPGCLDDDEQKQSGLEARDARRVGVLGYIFGSHGFVKHPTLAGMWLRVHRSAVEHSCPCCRAPAGAPCCKEDGSIVMYVHRPRRVESGGE